MLADCHLHTEFSTDSETPMRAQAERALELGIPAICVTDHMDMDYPQGEFWLDTDRYMEAVRRLQEEYRGRLEIGFGVELGLMEHLRARQEEYLKKYPFDFVIGSVHLIHGEDPYNGSFSANTGTRRCSGIFPAVPPASGGRAVHSELGPSGLCGPVRAESGGLFLSEVCG